LKKIISSDKIKSFSFHLSQEFAKNPILQQCVAFQFNWQFLLEEKKKLLKKDSPSTIFQPVHQLGCQVFASLPTRDFNFGGILWGLN
jgi:hypothetical protein